MLDAVGAGDADHDHVHFAGHSGRGVPADEAGLGERRHLGHIDVVADRGLAQALQPLDQGRAHVTEANLADAGEIQCHASISDLSWFSR